jgi:hypothetical protein
MQKSCAAHHRPLERKNQDLRLFGASVWRGLGRVAIYPALTVPQWEWLLVRTRLAQLQLGARAQLSTSKVGGSREQC